MTFSAPYGPAAEHALQSLFLGAPVSQHFLTLPSGMTLDVPEGKDSWDVYTPHALACLSEGMCPLCQGQLDEHRQCYDWRHRPCRWHCCGEYWGQVFLDVPPRRSDPATCDGCGGVM